MSRYWYFYDGTGDDTDPVNYLRRPSGPSSLCPTGGKTSCAIYSEPNSIDPTKPTALSTNLLAYLVQSKNLSSPQPSFPAKPYVYSRPSI
jgi:hypothetical protein